jgi:3-oxoacyl-(acyl-carrier-protein) synthase
MMHPDLRVEILNVGVTSPAGNTLDAVLSSINAPPSPTALRFPEVEGHESTEGLRCDLSQARDRFGPMKIRRWGRLQTMSLLAAQEASLPDILNGCEAETGVYVGTGLGSLDETAMFLENMILQNENFPKPATFVNSVHNTVGSHLALEFGLKGENITVAHREISFDAALGHALSALQQGRVKYAVVCGVDELNAYRILAGSKKGLWKKNGLPFKPLSPENTRGTFPGEGSAVCVLAACENVPFPNRQRSESALGRVLGVQWGRYKRENNTSINLKHAGDFLESLLSSAGVRSSDVDLMLLGADGDNDLDAIYRGVGAELERRAGRKIPQGAFKHLCGDYRAASGFGFALSSLLLNSGRIPAGLLGSSQPISDVPLRTVLLYNLSRSGVHSGCIIGKP